MAVIITYPLIYTSWPWLQAPRLFGMTADPGSAVPEGEGRYIHASFSGNGDALAALCDYQTCNYLQIINYRALQSG